MRTLIVVCTLALLGAGPALAQAGQAGSSSAASGNAESNNKPTSNSGTAGSTGGSN